MIWLAIDTANIPLSVAIVQDGKILTEENSAVAINHSLRAMPAIEEAFERAKIKPSDIDRIVVAEGPGSYTGVRIGVTIAKTLSWTLEKPLVGVSSIEALAMNVGLYEGYVCPLIDARRKHVYTGAYDMKAGQMNAVIPDQHIDIETWILRLKELNKPVLFIGQDIEMYREELKEQMGEQALFAPFQLNVPRASSLVAIAENKETLAEVHEFVPSYHRIAEAEANWLKAQRKE